MSVVDSATTFAFDVHRGQSRKWGGGEYIQHPVRVALRVSRLPGALPDHIAVALLHDVIEDCGVTHDILMERFGLYIARTVYDLSDVYSKNAYPGWNRAQRKREETKRLSELPMWTVAIKLCDIADNLTSMPADEKFASIFLQEKQELLDLLTERFKGNAPQGVHAPYFVARAAVDAASYDLGQRMLANALRGGSLEALDGNMYGGAQTL